MVVYTKYKTIRGLYYTKGQRQRPMAFVEPERGGELNQEEEEKFQEKRARRKATFDASLPERKRINDQLAEFELSSAAQKEVDRRYSTIQWPKRYANKYLPMKDTGSFTSADWIHFIVYAGPWIMEGLIPRVYILILQYSINTMLDYTVYILDWESLRPLAMVRKMCHYVTAMQLYSRTGKTSANFHYQDGGAG